MSLATLNHDDVALIGQVLRALAAGDIVEEFEFSARIGVQLVDLREMVLRWPAWDDADDKSAECLVINNTLNDLLHGIGLSERQCIEMLGVGRNELLRVYRVWADSRGWNATGVR